MKTDDKAVNCPLRVAVLGGSDVGKSALTVRYLTKRFIGEYRSDSDMLYKCVLQVDGANQPVEILDTSAKACDDAASDTHYQWAEAFVVVYSISDRSSFKHAESTLQDLVSMRPTANVLVLGNKNDLGHLREVEEMEARSLAFNYSARFAEVSTAESCVPVTGALDSFLKEVKSQRQCSSGHALTSGSPKQRKISVTRMLGSLIGRHSPPPQHITELIILDKEERSKLVRCSRQI